MKRNFLTGLLGSSIGLMLLFVIMNAAGVVGAQGRSDVARDLNSNVTAPARDVASTTISSTFTYQGQLKTGSTPVSSTCAMTFTLYDAANGNGIIGTPMNNVSVSVNNGYFTQGLNFGANAFTGESRWLDIQLNCGSGFNQLSPRQALTAAPYAIHALDAGALQSYPVSTTVPANGQVLKWNGSAWTPGTDLTGGGGSYSNGFGLNLIGNAFSVITNTIQQRVISSCSSGNAIRVINADGTVACQSTGGGSGWSLTGNTGTTSANYLGTTDNMSLTLAVSGTAALRIMPNDTSPNIIGGYSGNFISPTVVGGTIGGGGNSGQENRIWNNYATIGGGQNNIALANNSFVGGGISNTVLITGSYATIGGGYHNTAGALSGDSPTVGGGWQNTASYNNATVAGGGANIASGESSTVGGGYANISSYTSTVVAGGEHNTSSSHVSTIAGGGHNIARASAGTIAGGWYNTVSNTYATVSGGWANTATGYGASIGGGYNNTASGNNWATIAGGGANVASGGSSFIGGGDNNTVSNTYATIGGGAFNTVSNYEATIGGGSRNTASGPDAAIGGGHGNIASGPYAATIGGGDSNTASGQDSTIPGGYSNTASGDYSFAAGYKAWARYAGSFVWNDSSDIGAPFGDSRANEFNVRASGGTRIFSSDAYTSGVLLAPGSGAWSSVSDRNLKANFAPVDNRAILKRVSAMPVTTWNYKSQDESIRHIGPMAQDFSAAFNVGENDTTISTIDAQGVAFAAIQGLYQENQDLKARVAQLEQNTTPAPFNFFNLISVLALIGFAAMWLQQRKRQGGKA
jgi:hypothetical protein